MEEKNLTALVAQPPPDLLPRSHALWQDCVPRLSTESQVELLYQALKARDLAEMARQELEQTGLVMVSRRSGIPRAHPLTAVVDNSLRQFTRIFAMLGLHTPPPSELEKRLFGT